MEYRIEIVSFYLSSLPKTLTINFKNQSVEINKDWLRSISEFFNNLLSECSTDMVSLIEDDIFHFN